MPEWSLSCPRLLSNDQQVETSFGGKACFQWTQQARQSPSVPSKWRPQTINQLFFLRRTMSLCSPAFREIRTRTNSLGEHQIPTGNRSKSQHERDSFFCSFRWSAQSSDGQPEHGRWSAGSAAHECRQTLRSKIRLARSPGKCIRRKIQHR